MDLISNSTCSLCDENTSVLSRKAVQPFITTVGKVFFNANKNEFKQFQDELHLKTICSLCAQKISASTKFKSSYDSVNKRNGLKKNRCFVCSKKGFDLIRTSDDPNDIITKLTLFTNYSSNNGSYEDCELCLDCLFHINSWCEVHNNLIRRLNIDGQSLKGFQRTNCNSNVLKKDKENVTPPHNNIQTSNTKLRTPAIKKKLIGPKSKKKFFGQSKKSKTKNNKLATQFSSGKLKSIKCLQDGTFKGLSWPESVSSDRKMLMEIPYVLIPQIANKDNAGPQERKSSRLNKPVEIIYISDTEEEPVKRTTRVSFQLPISTIIEQNNLTCNLCDKEFTVISKYQSHSLWHEKPERCQIDLVRYELPNYVKASEFNINKKPTKVNEDIIDEIVSKYIPPTENIDNDAEAKEEDERIHVSEDVDDEKLNPEEPEQSDSLCENEISNHTEIDLVNNVQDSENLEKEVENLNKEDTRAQSVSPTSDLCLDTSNTIETEVACNPESESGKDDVEETSEEPEDIHNNTDDQINSSKESIVTNETNGESDIEKALAKLHQEDDDEEKDLDDKEENLDGNEEASDAGTNASDDDNDGSEVSLKRKRVDSPGYEENSDDQNNSDENTPKIKKVRFAIDYSCTQQSNEAVRNNDDEKKLNNGEEHTEIAVNNEDDNVC